MSAACRAAIRRDSDFIAAHSGEIVYTGQFGTLCGVPVLFSALVPDGMAIITDRNAVKFFVKREASLEQDRDIETKINTVVYERCGLIALVDDTSTVILGKKAAVRHAYGQRKEDKLRRYLLEKGGLCRARRRGRFIVEQVGRLIQARRCGGRENFGRGGGNGRTLRCFRRGHGSVKRRAHEGYFKAQSAPRHLGGR